MVGRQRSVSHVVGPHRGSGFDGLGWAPSGPIGARRGSTGFRMGPYINRTPIQDSQVIRQVLLGPVGPRTSGSDWIPSKRSREAFRAFVGMLYSLHQHA